VPTVPSFADLCRCFCALQGLPAPALDAGREGLQAFTLDVSGISLTVVHDAQADPDALFLVAELGTPPDDEAELRGWFALLEANYWLRADNAPMFSRNPQTGEVILQWTQSLAQSTAQSLHDAVTKMTDLACRWHPAPHHRLPPPPRELGLAAFA
jgi:hypothetical protein